MPVDLLAFGILGLAFVLVLCLGFYERQASNRMIAETMQRLTLTIQATATARISPSYSPPPAAPVPRAEPVQSDVSDDEVWRELNATWAREALDQKQAEEDRAMTIQRALREAQARKAAEFAAEGKLEVEPTAERQPAAVSP